MYSFLREGVNTPYMFSFQLAVQKCLFHLDMHGNKDSIAFIHEDNDYKGEALRCFDWIKHGSWHAPREMTLTFAPKSKATPLQAADIFAYEGNKRMRNINSPERKAWRAINPDRNKVNLDYFGYEAISEWARVMIEEGRLG